MKGIKREAVKWKSERKGEGEKTAKPSYNQSLDYYSI